MKRAAAIGECMIEITTGGAESDTRGTQQAYGGDTLNTAVYMARSLDPDVARVDYVTALGDDPFSDEMVAAWRREGIGTEWVFRLRGRLRWNWDDFKDNENLEHSVWGYADLTYRLRKKDRLRLRYDYVRFLDDRMSTLERTPNPEHWLWVQYEAKF